MLSLKPVFDAHTEDTTEETDEHPRQNSRNHGAFPQALYTVQTEPSEQRGDADERDVVDDLEVPERQPGSVGQRQYEAFPGNDRGAAGNFQHDAERHDDAACERHGHAHEPCLGNEGMAEPQPQIDEQAEDEHARKLEKLSSSERLSQQGNLRKQHENIDAKSSRSHGYAENSGDDIRHAGNGCRAELSVGDKSDAVPHEEQAEKKNDPAFHALSGNVCLHTSPR